MPRLERSFGGDLKQQFTSKTFLNKKSAGPTALLGAVCSVSLPALLSIRALPLAKHAVDDHCQKPRSEAAFTAPWAEQKHCQTRISCLAARCAASTHAAYPRKPWGAHAPTQSRARRADENLKFWVRKPCRVRKSLWGRREKGQRMETANFLVCLIWCRFPSFSDTSLFVSLSFFSSPKCFLALMFIHHARP